MAEIRAVIDHAAVQEAERYLVEIEKKPTYTNISIITGIERRRVSSLLTIDTIDGPKPPSSSLHRAVRVLNGWHEDPAYMNAQGFPADLDVRGGSGSFEALVSEYAGGISGTSILERLVETRAVEVIERDEHGRAKRVRAARQTIEPDVNETRIFEEFGATVADALEMLDSSLRATAAHERIRPYTVTAVVAGPSLRLLRRQLRERGERVQATIDETLIPHELSPAQVTRLTGNDPSALYSVRVTLFSTIKPLLAGPPVFESAWRRSPEQNTLKDGRTTSEPPQPPGRRKTLRGRRGERPR